MHFTKKGLCRLYNRGFQAQAAFAFIYRSIFWRGIYKNE